MKITVIRNMNVIFSFFQLELQGIFSAVHLKILCNLEDWTWVDFNRNKTIDFRSL